MRIPASGSMAKRWLLVIVASALSAVCGAQGDARAQTTPCVPACRTGEMCVSGMCMVPAQRAPAPATEAPQAVEAAPPGAVAPAPAPVAQQPEPAAPPPVYVPPAPRAPVSTATTANVPRVREGMLFMPFIGLHSFQDSSNSGLDAGLRAGAMLGSFITNDLSLNAAFTFDLLNTNNNELPPGATVDSSAQMFELTFSPFFHVGSPKVELILGPKLGGWIGRSHADLNIPGIGAFSGDSAVQGWTLGGNMGVLAAVSPAALAGVIFSLEVRDILHGCTTVTGEPEQCQSSGESSTILGFSFVLML